ncbi:hypothetical protein [Caballeronia sp. GAFFF2]|uniref:hypothetical protein n=1 Tax=Caballeronia sp. GAFFF2 TaxID=2921741 RepID=UPI002027AAA3|nr:hypothetical protein [Caballeronia sp. GAFFF2]
MPRLLPLWAAFLAIIIVLTSVYGGYHYYSPIPFWDQWDDYVGLFRRIEQGQYSIFWAQHMEHRLILPRAVFLLDILLFGGWNIFDIAVVYALLFGIARIFWNEYTRGRAQHYPRLMIGSLIVGFLLLWCQKENLTWGFQVQVPAIYLFSLLAFAEFSKLDKRALRVCLAVAFGILATASMGNGLVAFFVMAIQGLIQRRPWRESTITAIVGAAVATIYFHNYIKPQLEIDPVVAQISFARVKFFFMFLGSPAYYVWENLFFSASVGIMFVVVGSVTTAYLYLARAVTPYRSFLIATFGMTVAGAMGAANSRWMLGLIGASASRYTTPVLIGYITVMLLFFDLVKTRSARTKTGIIALLVLTFLAGVQLKVGRDNAYLYDWKLAVLGQKIGLDHPSYDGMIYPMHMHDNYLLNSAYAATTSIGPWGSGWLHDAGTVKFNSAQVDTTLCMGYIDTTSPDGSGTVATGWIVQRKPNWRRSSALIVLTDAAGQTVGYGVTGQKRTDVEAQVGAVGMNGGWTGFAQGRAKDLSAYAYLERKFCPLQRVSRR